MPTRPSSAVRSRISEYGSGTFLRALSDCDMSIEVRQRELGTVMIQLAWLSVRYQPEPAPARCAWRFGNM